MGFIDEKKQREMRLRLSKTVKLPDADMEVRVSKMIASSGFVLSGSQKDEATKTAALFIGTCITDKGNPLFKSMRDVDEFLSGITAEDAGILVKQIQELSKPREPGEEPGNSEGSPSDG